MLMGRGLGGGVSFKQRSRKLRKNATEAEMLLWAELRGHQLNGFQFRRQHPIRKKYILDFYCAARKVAVELDGSVHLKARVRQLDLLRSEELGLLGIRVLRFTNEEIMLHRQKVLQDILNALDQD